MDKRVCNGSYLCGVNRVYSWKRLVPLPSADNLVDAEAIAWPLEALLRELDMSFLQGI